MDFKQSCNRIWENTHACHIFPFQKDTEKVSQEGENMGYWEGGGGGEPKK